MTKNTWLILLFVVFAGCAMPQQLMVQPSTGTVIDCSTVGWGLAGTTVALAAHSNCIARYRAVGYITLEEYNARKLDSPPPPIKPGSPRPTVRITTTPSGATVWCRVPSGIWLYVGVTPFEKELPDNSRFWQAECYMAQLDGYEKSQEVCTKATYEDRTVHINLVPRD